MFDSCICFTYTWVKKWLFAVVWFFFNLQAGIWLRVYQTWLYCVRHSHSHTYGTILTQSVKRSYRKTTLMVHENFLNLTVFFSLSANKGRKNNCFSPLFRDSEYMYAILTNTSWAASSGPILFAKLTIFFLMLKVFYDKWVSELGFNVPPKHKRLYGHMASV